MAKINRAVGRRVEAMKFDNSWFVPYLLLLNKMFECPLKVEMCISCVGGIKYLFNYVCKRSNRLIVEMVGNNVRYD